MQPVPVLQTVNVPAAASTTTAFPAFAVAPGPIGGCVLLATLTGMSASTLDLYIQESWDGGVTWADVAHFTQLAAAAAAATTRVSLTSTGTSAAKTVGKGTLAAPGVALAAGTFVDGPWGPLLRFVSVTGSGANGGPVAQTITLAAFHPPGS